MKVSLNWLKKYVAIDIPTDALIDRMASTGFDIESVENQADKYKNFVVGKVLEKKKHPNADKLSLCKVDIGSEILDVVCGAPNVDSGQLVCFAKVGAIIPNGGFELKKATIRGEKSEGMICSASELNLGEDHSGIMVLENRVPVGSPFSEYLGEDDVIIDISITPNRGDLLSHFGVAREIGGLLGEKMNVPEVKVDSSTEDISKYASVKIDNPGGCYRYCGRLVRNITVKDSPDWLKKHLISVGLRPINNVVDVSNFVMLESGQPLHTFDFDLLKGGKIIVKSAGNIKKFKTLDEKERDLRDDVLLICDGEKPVALAGIMGGANSEILDTTKNVFIESAYFDPILTRRSSKFLSLQTDSSYRFERGVDMSKVDWSCNRAAILISELAGGEIVGGIIDNYPNKIESRTIALDIKHAERIIGIQFQPNEVIELLEKIEINCLGEKDGNLLFQPPMARNEDLIRDIDLIEEIARLYGYEKISGNKTDKVHYRMNRFDDAEFEFMNTLRSYLVGRGFKEIISNSLVPEEEAAAFDQSFVRLLNPSSQEMNATRPNLFIGALEAVKNNFSFKSTSLKLFEFGHIFLPSRNPDTLVPGVNERKCLSMILAGDHEASYVNEKSRLFEIFDLKGEVKALLDKLNIDNDKLNYYNYGDYYDYRVEYLSGNRSLGSIYSFSSQILQRYGISKPVFCAELDISELQKLGSSVKMYSEISKFPPVLRDLSFVVPRNVRVGQIEDEIWKNAGNLLRDIDLYDIYEFKDDGQDKLSYTFALKFSSDEKTLTDAEINRIQDKIFNNLNKKLNAQMRT